MRYYIMLDNDKKIELPDELDTQERIKLCEDIINEYPSYFTQCIACSTCSEIASYKVELRLEIMANYILNSANKKSEYPIMSEYKKKLIKHTEVLFSDLEQKYDFNDFN